MLESGGFWAPEAYHALLRRTTWGRPPSAMWRFLAAVALCVVAEAARRPGASWSEALPDEDDDDATLHSACAGLSPDLARYVLDHAPLTYRVALAWSMGNRVLLWGSDSFLGGYGGVIRGVELFPSGELALTWSADGFAWEAEVSCKIIGLGFGHSCES